MKRYRIRVHGRVHAVGFRYSTRHLALKLGLRGFVRNDPDGSVYIEAEGQEQQLEKLHAWCHRGPAFAHVENVEYDTQERSEEFTTFEIKHV